MKNRCVLDLDVAESFLRLPSRQRAVLLKIFHHITDNMHVSSKAGFRDPGGRWIEQKVVEGWEISYWEDGPVWEVRIVGVRKTK